MAKDDVPKSADKGKGKAVDDKVDDPKKGKDAQPNGKKDEKIVDCESPHLMMLMMVMMMMMLPRLARPCSALLTRIPTAAEELSEEDQQLKSELDMLVERLTV